MKRRKQWGLSNVFSHGLRVSALILLVITIVFCGLICSSEAFAKTKKKAKCNTSLKPPSITLETSLRLFKGDQTYIDVGGAAKAQKVKFISYNKKIATVSSKGLIKAKKCGSTYVVATLRDKRFVRRIKYKVIVSYSSYMSRKCRGKGLKKKGSMKLTGYSYMYIGEDVSIAAVTKTSGADVRLTSSKNDVVSIKNGRLIANSSGYSTITAEMSYKGRKTRVRLKVKVSPKPILEVTNQMKDDWFRGSAMAGHSIGVGLEMYCRSQYDGFLGNAMHLSVGCYSVYNDKTPVSGSSIHVSMYGVKRRLKDHVSAFGIKKLFINLGTNDVGIFGPDQFALEYQGLINELLAQNPETTVYIVAITPVYSPKGLLNNECIAQANRAMEQFADVTDRCQYIDTFTPMLDEFGRLNPVYCSDQYCHITFEGYAVFTDALKRYAEGQIRYERDKADAAKTKEEASK